MGEEGYNPFVHAAYSMRGIIMFIRAHDNTPHNPHQKQFDAPPSQIIRMQARAEQPKGRWIDG